MDESEDETNLESTGEKVKYNYSRLAILEILTNFLWIYILTGIHQRDLCSVL